MIFSIYFYPYYYRISKYGKIIKYNYISALCNDSLTSDDFFITYECDKNLKLFNRVIFEDTLLMQTIPLNINCTKYVFTNIFVTIFDKEYTIYLRSDNYNFYLVGNIINYSFIQYYILNILQTNVFSYFNKELYNLLYIKGLIKSYAIQGIKVPYSLSIIDHKFNMITITQDDSIILNCSDYTIKNT
jgi:hypothetical protein